MTSKKSKIIIRAKRVLIALLFFVTLQLSAQNNAVAKHFDDFIAKHSVKISYVSQDMFNTIMKKNEDEYEKELTDVMRSLSSLHVVTSYKKNPDRQYNEAMKVMRKTDYELLFTKEDQVDKFSLFIKKKRNKINEMVLVARDHVDFVILDITGDIDLNSIVYLGEALHFQGSEFLDQMNLSEAELRKLHID